MMVACQFFVYQRVRRNQAWLAAADALWPQPVCSVHDLRVKYILEYTGKFWTGGQYKAINRVYGYVLLVGVKMNFW